MKSASPLLSQLFAPLIAVLLVGTAVAGYMSWPESSKVTLSEIQQKDLKTALNGMIKNPDLKRPKTSKQQATRAQQEARNINRDTAAAIRAWQERFEQFLPGAWKDLPSHTVSAGNLDLFQTQFQSVYKRSTEALQDLLAGRLAPNSDALDEVMNAHRTLRASLEKLRSRGRNEDAAAVLKTKVALIRDMQKAYWIAKAICDTVVEMPAGPEKLPRAVPLEIVHVSMPTRLEPDKDDSLMYGLKSKERNKTDKAIKPYGSFSTTLTVLIDARDATAFLDRLRKHNADRQTAAPGADLAPGSDYLLLTVQQFHLKPVSEEQLLAFYENSTALTRLNGELWEGRVKDLLDFEKNGDVVDDPEPKPAKDGEDEPEEKNVTAYQLAQIVRGHRQLKPENDEAARELADFFAHEVPYPSRLTVTLIVHDFNEAYLDAKKKSSSRR